MVIAVVFLVFVAVVGAVAVGDDGVTDHGDVLYRWWVRVRGISRLRALVLATASEAGNVENLVPYCTGFQKRGGGEKR